MPKKLTPNRMTFTFSDQVVQRISNGFALVRQESDSTVTLSRYVQSVLEGQAVLPPTGEALTQPVKAPVKQVKAVAPAAKPEAQPVIVVPQTLTEKPKGSFFAQFQKPAEVEERPVVEAKPKSLVYEDEFEEEAYQEYKQNEERIDAVMKNEGADAWEAAQAEWKATDGRLAELASSYNIRKFSIRMTTEKYPDPVD